MDVRSPFFQNIALILAGVMFLNPIVASAAQLTVDAQAGGNTTIGQAQNGVPVVNIATPNGSGLSHNKFTDYNVGQQGLILNNGAQAFVPTQLGGYITGNPNLQGGAANVILNEVTGSNRSQLKGYTEVAGQAAHVIVANPHGITCDGCGFINTPRATLTTGAPVVDNGRLQRFDVNGGDIAIEGAGLNAGNVDQFDLITRSAQINAEIHAKRLNVIAGRNEVDVATLQATAKADDGSSQPNLAIDSSALGGMYAGAIRLVGTEAGVGVKLAGDMAASAGDIQIDANGQLTTNRMAASNDIKLVASDIKLGADAYAGRNAKANAKSTLSLDRGKSLVASEKITLEAQQISNRGVIEAGVNNDNSRNSSGVVSLSGGSLRNEGTVLASGKLDASLSSTLDNRSGSISGKSSTRIAAMGMDNSEDGLVLSSGDLAVEVETLNNHEGTLLADESLTVRASKRLDNRGGEISSSKTVSAQADFMDNRGGHIKAGSALTVTAGRLDNSIKGALSSNGSLRVRDADLNNQGGAIIADQHLELAGKSLDNRAGVISGAADSVVAVTGVLDNSLQGRVVAEGRLSIAAGDLRNTARGQIGAKGDVDVQADTFGQQGGELLSQGQLNVTTRQLDNRDGGLIAAHHGVKLQIADSLINRGGEISTQGAADIRVQAGAGQATAILDNSQAGLISGDQGLSLNVQRLLNHAKGVLTGRDHLVVAGESLNNSSGGVLSSQGGLEITLQGVLENQQQGLITSAATLIVNAASLDSSQSGEVSAKGNIRLTVARLIQQQGRLIGESAVHLNLQEGSLDNRGGLFSAKGPLTIERLSKFDNRGGELSSRQSYSLAAENLDNGDQGKLISAGELDINLGQGALRNAETGLISGWQGLTVKAGSLDNRNQGTLSSRDGALGIELSGALDSRDAGALVGKGALSVKAQSLDNSSGGIVSSAGNIDLTLTETLENSSGGLVDTQGALSIRGTGVNNRSGQISSQQSIRIWASRLDNSAGQLVSNGSMTLTLSGLLINAQKAKLASAGPLVLQVGTLDNKGGSLISQQSLQLIAGEVDNAGGTLAARDGLALLLNGAVNNSADGLIHSQQGHVDLRAQRLDNNAGNLSGHQGVLAKLDGALSNQRGRIESAQGDLDLQSTGTLDNRGGVINSRQGGVKLASGGAFDNASGTAQGQSIAVTSTAVDNRGGHLSSLGSVTTIDIGSGTFENQGGGLYAHQLLSVIAGDFNNNGNAESEGGKASAGRIDFSLSGALLNANGILESSSALRLVGARIDNQYGRLRALGAAGHTQLVSSALDNRNGLLETANTELVLNVDDLFGTGGTIRHTGQGSFGLNAVQVMGAGGNLSTNGLLSLNASNWTNSGVLEADQLVLNIGTFTQTASGKLLARQSFSGSGDNWSNQGLLASDGAFNLNLSGAYAGSGQLTSLGELALRAGSFDLTSSARIAGGDVSTIVSSAILNNKGRITSAGSLTVSSNDLNNYGTLGSAGALRLETPVLFNEKGLIFSGDDMALRVDRLTNRYADIYSLGILSIAKDDQWARAGLLENMSGTLESAKDMRLAVQTLENAKDVFEMEGKLLSAQAYLRCVQHCKNSWSDKRGELTLSEEWGAVISKDSPAGQILSGANLQIDSGSLINRYSTLSAANDIVVQATELENIGAQAMAGRVQRTITANPKESNGLYYNHERRVQSFMASHGTAATFSEAAYLAMKAGFSPAYYLGINAPISVAGTGQVLAPAIIQAGGNVSIQASKSIGNSQTYPNSAINHGQARGADVSLGRSTQSVVVLNSQISPDLQQRQVNPLTLPGFSLPQGENGLFRLNAQAGSAESASQAQNQMGSGDPRLVQGGPAADANQSYAGALLPAGIGQLPSAIQASKGHKYLIETNPAFTDLARFLNSDYLLGKLGYDPDQAQKRLGDGLYEQRLIREAVAARTGQRYLAGLTSDEAMFRYLMDNAVASKQALNLALGVSLSAEQVAALTHDIVWMEEHEVQGEKVLVPVLYMAQSNGRLAPNGALIQGRDVTLISGGSLNNQGTLRASQNLSATAGNISNSGLMQAGERLSALATESIRNAQGGIIAGRDIAANALSGDIINERSVTTFQSGASNYSYRQDYVDSAARIEALNDLSLNAGRDLLNTGGAVSAGRDLKIDAGRDLQIISATQHNLSSQKDRKGNSRREQITQYGADVTAGRDLTLLTERDLVVVASQVKSGQDLIVKAGEGILVAAAANESHYESHRKSGGKKVDIENSSVVQQAAVIEAGRDLSMLADGNVTFSASNLKTGGEAYLYAGEQLALLAAENSNYSLYDMQKKGSLGSKKTQRDEVTTVRNVGTTINTGGDLTLVSEGGQLYQKARLESGADLTLDSGGAITFETVKDLEQESHAKSSNSMVWTSAKGKGSTDETLYQSQLLAKGELVVKAVEGLRIDVKEVNQQSITQTIDAMVKADPELAWLKEMEKRGDIDWRQVKEVHESFKYSHSGLGGAAMIVIAIIVTYLTAGAASGAIGTMAGASAGSGSAMAAATTSQMMAAGASYTAAGWGNVALTAVATSAASNAAISTVNNRGNLGAVLKDVTSSDNLKGYASSALTAGITTGVLDSAFGVTGDNVNKVTKGFNLSKPTDLAKFGSYLGAQGAVQAVAQTTIQGGSLGRNLQASLTGQMQHLLQAGVFNGVGDFAKGKWLDGVKWEDGSPEKIALHAVVGGLLSEATGGDFKTGALASGANEFLIKRLATVLQDDKGMELVVSQMIGVAAATVTGGDVTKAAELAKNATAYNRQLHEEQIKVIRKLSDDPEKQSQLTAVLCVMQNCDVNGLSGYDADGKVIYDAGAQIRADSPELFKQLAGEINSAGLLNDQFAYKPGGVDFLKDALGKEWNDKVIGIGKTYDTATRDPESLSDLTKGVLKGLANNVKDGPQYPLDNADEKQGAIWASTALVVGPAAAAAGTGTLNAMGRAWETGKVLNAGEIAMSSGGNISAQQITRLGMPAGLSPAEMNALSTLDSLSSGAAGTLRETVSNSYFVRNGFKALDGKCGVNCFDGVYVKGNQVIVSEIKPLNTNGSIKLSPAQPSGLPTQGTTKWVESRANELIKSSDPAKVKTGILIQQAIKSGNLTTVVSGVSSNGMVIVKVKQ